MAERKLNVTEVARRDIQAISRDTRQRWGTTRAQAYRAQFLEAFTRILSFPESGRRWDEEASDLRYLPCGRHLIFYKVSALQVDIVRVLHERMDARRHHGLNEAAAAAYAP